MTHFKNDQRCDWIQSTIEQIKEEQPPLCPRSDRPPLSAGLPARERKLLLFKPQAPAPENPQGVAPWQAQRPGLAAAMGPCPHKGQIL